MNFVPVEMILRTKRDAIEVTREITKSLGEIQQKHPNIVIIHIRVSNVYSNL